MKKKKDAPPTIKHTLFLINDYISIIRIFMDSLYLFRFREMQK